MNLKGKKITVVGLGKSGWAAVRFLKAREADVRISEQKSRDEIPEDFFSWIKQEKIVCEFGGHTSSLIRESGFLLISPGVRFDSEPVRWAEEAGVPVIGEIELAARFCRGPIVAVTGSNGKTTVSTLIHQVLVNAGKKAVLCGNIGTPFVEKVDGLSADTVVVLEVSSFQLETIREFHPFVAVFLNISENHLDRHADLNEYFEIKKRIFMNQTGDDFAVLNAADPLVKTIDGIPSAVRWFCRPEENGTNPNFSAVKTVAGVFGIDESAVEKTFADFRGVEHRLEKVRDFRGVEFINDSKSTTAEAARWALASMTKPVIMLCGGRDKNIDFSVLRPLVARKVKQMIVFGEARDKIRRTFQEDIGIRECRNLEEAVYYARALAKPSDCVLLSPMCASFDAFKNFEERGLTFKQLVTKLS